MEHIAPSLYDAGKAAFQVLAIGFAFIGGYNTVLALLRGFIYKRHQRDFSGLSFLDAPVKWTYKFLLGWPKYPGDGFRYPSFVPDDGKPFYEEFSRCLSEARNRRPG
jgi:hypothetical protein